MKPFFANDYNCGCAPEVLDRLAKENMHPHLGYGNDEITKEAARKILEAAGAPGGNVYFSEGGTQANAIVISAYLKTYQGVIGAQSAHVNCHEAGSIEASGHKVLTMPSRSDKVDAAELEAYLEEFYAGDSYWQMVQPGMVYVSHPTEYGSLYTKKELEALRKVCDKYHLPLFLDGARLGYALAAKENDITLKDLGRLCDVFYVGGTKVGALFGEAIVFPKGMPDFFPTHARQRGAMPAKGFVTAEQFDTLFTDNLYVRLGQRGINLAMKLKKGLADKGYSFHIDSPTNQQFVILGNEQAKALHEKVDFENWERKDAEHMVVRFVTSWSTREEDVDTLLNLL
ncbi:MAG: aminotransferase class I/II-fold pyridoxal phosphate-dependent enzyme [Acidaminococcus sp.]|jgi:threonine aldolase|nr:aminotransferase class I/II-fold pyridoxal phosphate-dependent enzyme [Acidaminococcus sp.]MCI2100447.1 aminotransferase class I/II-fold pyridoxal phosphate-dependent enzyme [Acidaminococcus sp.]MCI2114768.1 aminotransferase class I/II-fold pyridoxal phosphate-dependent enzyme [Acidaminococcus sp.]MCI2116812.1 aminotransferase class I/II-fold pyridoxal phosphate-dependent enzyme [Acidaminococcus sp.]